MDPNGLNCNWTMIDDQLSISHVSVGPAGVWAVGLDQKVYYREGTYMNDGTRGTAWTEIPGVNLVQLDVGSRIVWGLTESGNIYFRTGIEMYNPTGCEWRLVSGFLKDISVSPKGHVWGVTSFGGMVRRAEVSFLNPEGLYWHTVGPSSIKFSRVSAGCAGVWALDENGIALYRNGTFDDADTPGSEWAIVEEPLKHVTVGHGKVWGIKGDYVTYRAGVAQALPTGVEWDLVYKTLKQFDVWQSALWGADSYDPQQVYARLI